MKKVLLLIIAAMFLVFLHNPGISGAEVDLTGNWVGNTLVPNQGEDEITLTVKRENNEYSALLNDTFGMLQNTESTSFEYKDDQLVIMISLPSDFGIMEVMITLTVAEDTLTGTWQTQEGVIGEITLNRE